MGRVLGHGTLPNALAAPLMLFSREEVLLTRHPLWLLAALALSVTAAPQAAQAAAAPKTKAWTVLETDHFSVHYYAGEERTARRIAQAAEEVLPGIAADFGVKVDAKIPVILDRNVFFNGQAEPIKDRIYLDPVLASSSVIGSKRFIAHELTHVVTFLALAKDGTLSKLSNLSALPTWFLEGIAQYEAEYWAPSNDRMLRLHTLDDTLLSPSERENFSLLGSEFGAAGYNEGYSLTRYIFDTYGRDKISKLFKLLRDGQESSLTRAFNRMTGQNIEAIQAAWENDLKEHYHKQTLDLKAQVPGSNVVIPSAKGEANIAPRLSPDGKRLAYLSSRHQDSYLYLRGHVMGFLSVMVADPDGKNPHELDTGKGRTASYAWSPDSKQIVVSAASEDEAGDPAFNLLVCDADGKNSRQLTHVATATDPSWRPGTTEIAYADTLDGKAHVKVVDTKTGKIRDLGFDLGDRLVEDLAWSPDGSKLAAATFLPGEGGKLVLLDPESRKVVPLTDGGDRVADVDPVWTPDAKSLVFSSNRDGMENLYRLSIADRKLFRLTQVYTGATKPHITPDGKALLWSTYRSTGSEIRTGKMAAGISVAYKVPSHHALPRITGGFKVASGGPAAGATGSALSVMGWAEHPYEPRMTNDIIIPQVTSDEKGQQLGVMAQYSDILDKQQLGLDVRFGLMSQRFSYAVTYVNRMQENPWAISLIDSPTIGIPDRINPDNLSGSLYYERQRGLEAKTQLGQFTLGTTFSFITALTQPDPKAAAGRVREGRLNSVSLGWGEQQVAPTFDADINPSKGYSVGTQYTVSDALLGSQFNFTTMRLGFNRHIPVFPDQRHNLTLSLAAGMSNGDAPPFFMGGAMGGGPLTPLRGYYAGESFGDRVAYAGATYTFPIRTHLDYQLGPLYFDKLYGATFVEGADAWQRGMAASFKASVGAEMRLRLALAGRQVVVLRVGVAHPLTKPGFDLLPYLAF